jgi:hypothetical protein
MQSQLMLMRSHVLLALPKKLQKKLPLKKLEWKL